ncbi:MAG: hypothetical protein ACTTJS_05680 [Wolinella sp.]
MNNISIFQFPRIDNADGVLISTMVTIFIIEMIVIFLVFIYEYYIKAKSNKFQSIKEPIKPNKKYSVGHYLIIMVIIANGILFYNTVNFIKEINAELHEAKEVMSEKKEMIKKLNSAKAQLEYSRQGNNEMKDRLYKITKENENLKAELEQKTNILNKILEINENLNLKASIERKQETVTAKTEPKTIEQAEIKRTCNDKPVLIIRSYDMKRN